MATIPQQHYYDPKAISPTDPEPRHRCHCGFRFDRWEEFTEHIVRVTVTAAQTIIDAPARREFTGRRSWTLSTAASARRSSVSGRCVELLSRLRHPPPGGIDHRGRVERGVVHSELGVSLAIERMGNDGRDVPERAGEA
jgi:hypothetical protein